MLQVHLVSYGRMWGWTGDVPNSKSNGPKKTRISSKMKFMMEE